MAVKILKPFQQSTAKERFQKIEQQRGHAAARGYTYRWQQYSKQFLATHPLCAQCQKEGRIEPAEVVDHIIPVKDANDPRFWDSTNHQSLSRHCHYIKTRQDMQTESTRGYTGGRVASQGAAVTVVYGLAGSGKTTYVQSHMQRGDLILDMDALFAAISGLPLYDKPDSLLPFVAAARDAIYARLERVSSVTKAWIITTDHVAAQQLQRKFNAKLEHLRIDETERLRRLSDRKQKITGGFLK